MDSNYTFEADVELFPQDKGWFYVKVPLAMTRPLQRLADRGVIAVSATVGDSEWNTSLLPMGDGAHFIALPAKVRTRNNIEIGDRLSVAFALRER